MVLPEWRTNLVCLLKSDYWTECAVPSGTWFAFMRDWFWSFEVRQLICVLPSTPGTLTQRLRKRCSGGEVRSINLSQTDLNVGNALLFTAGWTWVCSFSPPSFLSPILSSSFSLPFTPLNTVLGKNLVSWVPDGHCASELHPRTYFLTSLHFSQVPHLEDA